jgi:N,N-dimethylformamidase
MRTRREFFREAGIGVAGAATLPLAAGAARAARPAGGLSPHRAMVVPGVHAYTATESVAAGEAVEICVSATVPYRLSVCRLGSSADDPSGDEVVQDLGESPPRPQPIHPGSYVHVEKGLQGPLPALGLECWVRLFRARGRQGLITQLDAPGSCGYGLFVTEEGGLAFYLGDGGPFRAEWWHSTRALLEAGRWHHVVASWDGESKTIWVDGKPEGRWPFSAPAGGVRAGRAPLRLAASGEDGVATLFLDGDLALPIVHGESIGEARVSQRYEDRGLTPVTKGRVHACWTLAEERGSRVADASRHRRHGRIVNHGTWMIGGPSYDPEIPRFGDYHPRKDPRRGHGLRFASDDLYDCGWAATHRVRIPTTARSGIYVARLRFSLDEKPCVQHATFVVRRPLRRRKAPLLVLAATNTWRAYSGTPFGVNQEEETKPVFGVNGVRNSPGDPPAYNFYRKHAAGQGTYQMGLRMPWPAAGPYVLYGAATGYSHLARADRFLHVWLERAGYAFDVITDLDLHRQPSVLDGYAAFVINGHSEYWSDRMCDGLDRYLRRRGSVVCLSGNSLFWRVSFDEAGGVVECRKVDAPGSQVPTGRRGECWHSQDGRRGGLLRDCGRPGWRLIGLDCLGWNNHNRAEQFGAFMVDQADHFLFHRPEPVGIKQGEPIGQAESGALPRANGHEFDVRPSILAALQQEPSPAGGTVPGDPPGMVRLASGVMPWKLGGTCLDYFARPIRPQSEQGGEMIYWERPEGGRVFNAGTIGAGWALLADKKLERLMRNVLHHFGVRPA